MIILSVLGIFDSHRFNTDIFDKGFVEGEAVKDMNEDAAWPEAVYLETSILRQLPTDVTTAELLRLREICKGLDIPIVIPKVALNEWMADRKSEFIEKARRYETATEKMTTLKDKYLIHIELPLFDELISPKDKKSICDEIETMLRSRIREIGGIVAETPNIALDLLLKMSIDKVRPFEEKGEKGFRDSVILFTILEYAKKLSAGFHLLVTKDKIFDHADIHQVASDYKIKLIVVDSIQAAIDELEKFISKVIKEIYAKRAELLRGFLNSHGEEISDFIRRQQSFGGLFGFKSEEGFSPEDVKAITSVELLEIHNPTPGILPEGVKKDSVKISFSAKVKFSLVITQYYFNTLARVVYGPKFEFEQESGAWKRKDEYGSFRPEEVATTIERDLKIEASALLDEDLGQYSELQLERVV